MRSHSLLNLRYGQCVLQCFVGARAEKRHAKSIFLSKQSWNRPFSPSEYLFYRSFIQQRFFQNESEYHCIADETLEDIQDAVEMALEDKGVADFDVTYASGVLTMVLPPHGTYVLNKQTPNRQIW